VEALTFINLTHPGDVEVNSFRPIYYLGCKAEFASAIKAAIDQVDPSGGRLGDIFAGTGAVAASLGERREVTTVDVQEYSRVLCSAVLNPARISSQQITKIISDIEDADKVSRNRLCLKSLIAHEQECIHFAVNGELDALIELLEAKPLAARDTRLKPNPTKLDQIANEVAQSLKSAELWHSPDTTVSRLFGGVYFSFEQAVMLDAILTSANSYGNDARDTLVAAALSTASMLVNTVGKQFAQPLRPKNKRGTVKAGLVDVVRRDRSMNALRVYELWLRKYSTLPRAVGQPLALRQDYREAIAGYGPSLSVLYADPPYTRDHYSRFYHVLETMCLRDNPTFSHVTKGGELTVPRGLYREDRHQSDFCIRSLAPAAFTELFANARKSDLPLVLSYSPHEVGDGTHPRVVSMDKIMDIAREHYDRVEVSAINGSTHNILNRSGLKLQAREHAEVLVKCFR
jgi:adenine-specific DNA methylase